MFILKTTKGDVTQSKHVKIHILLFLKQNEKTGCQGLAFIQAVTVFRIKKCEQWILIQ